MATEHETRSERPAPLFHVVLVEPEIPNNTGNIGRTCVAFASALHLIHPLGFDTSEKACRRAGLDYWPRLDVRHHESHAAYVAAARPARAWMFSGLAEFATPAGPARPRPMFEASFAPGDHLVFGKETKGLPTDLLAQDPARVLRFPMVPGERGLNLATAVCAALTEAIRQSLAAGAVGLDERGNLDLASVARGG
ncbi:MAG: tRNA (cytidine(34)-2'-O)-methyltransferase [Planctomycetota bacterium]|nr:tRNA (cytidine(34)-2'-O)-methyltransferase [Planctomycetota bacterium]